MPDKHANVGNVPIKPDLHIKIKNSLEICLLLIFYTTMHIYS